MFTSVLFLKSGLDPFQSTHFIETDLRQILQTVKDIKIREPEIKLCSSGLLTLVYLL